MFCTKCGTEIVNSGKFCHECGTPTMNGFAAYHRPSTPISRPLIGRKIGGVCAGFARYLGTDVTVIRIVAVILLLWPVPFIGGIAYLIALIVMPNDVSIPAAAPQATATV